MKGGGTSWPHVWVGLLLTMGLLGGPLAWPAAAQPQLRQMAGVPLPSNEVPAGTVTVRVVREELSNNQSGVEVQLTDGKQTRTARTDAEGRAQFTGVPVGLQVRAQVTADGETVSSQMFPIPQSSGVRLVLALGIGMGSGGVPTTPAGPGGPGPVDGGGAQAPVQSGQVTLGAESRIIVEIAEGGIEVYLLFEVANPAQTPVDPGAPLVFRVPEGASGLALLEGSIPAAVEGNAVSVPGPFPPGSSLLEFAYRLPIDADRLILNHVMPVALAQAAIVVRKIGNVDVASPLIQQRREVPMENRVYLLATGAAVPAGQAFTVEINGLPAHAQWPRYLALGLAGLIVIGGVGLEVTGGRANARLKQELSASREQLLGSLVQLEKQRRAGKVAGSGYASRRHALVGKLERVYADLEDVGALTRPASGPGSRAATV